MPVVVVENGTKATLKKLVQAKKPAVVCFVSKTTSPEETRAAVERMEEGQFQVKTKAVFIIVSLDNAKAAGELHKEAAIRNCVHVVSTSGGKEYGIKRTPAHVVIGADGKIKLQTEEEAAAYMALVM